MDKIKSLGGAALAYIGDAVLEVLVREKLISDGQTDTGKLSAAAQALVCAEKQSELCDKLLPLLDENETDVYHLGRNYKPSSKPRHAGAVEYHRASGFEAVFGYLHLCGKNDRAAELFRKMYENE
ncbi:MAG: ribonuclease III [Clostridia bacterium]|nr:ribonuclease III [Clostridia bacterium]